jgi:hypothetical protein
MQMNLSRTASVGNGRRPPASSVPDNVPSRAPALIRRETAPGPKGPGDQAPPRPALGRWFSQRAASFSAATRQDAALPKRQTSSRRPTQPLQPGVAEPKPPAQTWILDPHRCGGLYITCADNCATCDALIAPTAAAPAPWHVPRTPSSSPRASDDSWRQLEAGDIPMVYLAPPRQPVSAPPDIRRDSCSSDSSASICIGLDLTGFDAGPGGYAAPKQ